MHCAVWNDPLPGKLQLSLEVCLATFKTRSTMDTLGVGTPWRSRNCQRSSTSARSVDSVETFIAVAKGRWRSMPCQTQLPTQGNAVQLALELGEHLSSSTSTSIVALRIQVHASVASATALAAPHMVSWHDSGDSKCVASNLRRTPVEVGTMLQAPARAWPNALRQYPNLLGLLQKPAETTH